MKITEDVHVYGLGYVGLTLSIILAENGYNVTGIDKDVNKIKLLNKNKSYLHERNLEKRLLGIIKKKNALFLTKLKKHPAQYHIICVATPINKNKIPITKNLFNVASDICINLKKGDCIIIRSTVPIGFTRKIIKFITDKTKLSVGEDFYICHAPERTIEGNALEELISNPQILGGYSNKCLEKGLNFFKKINDKIILVKNLESAEIAKLIDNSYRDTVFAFSNEISEICERYNLDAIDIIKKCNSDYKRNNIPLPSPGVGGACLTKDPHILSYSASKKNYRSKLITSSRSVNKKSINLLTKKILLKIKKYKNPKILICGLAFKGFPETADIRYSTTLDFIDLVTKKNKDIQIFVYDPIIKKNEINKINLEYKNIFNLTSKVHGIILFNNHPSFCDIDIEKINKYLIGPKILCDCWGLLRNNNFYNLDQIDYFGVGF